MTNIKIVIADDHSILREGLCSLFDKQDDIDVVAESSNGEETLEILRRHHPDVILLDISMPGMSGLEVLKLGQAVSPKTRFVILSRYDNDVYIHKALEAGAFGYVVKGASSKELIKAIQDAYHHKYYLSSQIQEEVIHSYVKDHKPEQIIPKNRYERLSIREKQVFSLLVEGYSAAKIADILCISLKTVHKHRASISHKIGIDSPVKMLQYAIKKGLIDPNIWN
ncbi:response regulator transcription factor, partial [Thalassotalea sp. ND16A]|uniref:response regulator transcription factor n=1 Tax=Thalassotalea sp. ND16A TaxID=1535422 RepID=UPI000519FA3A